MSYTVERVLPLLKIIKVVPSKTRSNILRNSDDELIRAIAEICLNFCAGNIQCDKKSYKKLKKYKNCIHRLAEVKKKQKNYKKERILLSQKGSGFLPILLPTVLSALTEYFLAK